MSTDIITSVTHMYLLKGDIQKLKTLAYETQTFFKR